MSGYISNKIIKLQSVDSTNNYATRLIMSSSPEEWTIISAEEQLSGKGQKGNKWESEKGKNILLSIIIFPNFLEVYDQFLLSKVTSLGICDVISMFSGSVSIKWPNDIYVDKNKISGILIENSVTGIRMNYSIIGIGLNINQKNFLSDAPNPISLCEILKKELDRNEIFGMLISSIYKWYLILKEGKIDLINDAYVKSMYMKDVSASFKDSDGIFTGKIKGVDQIGRLIIEKEGVDCFYGFKEVEFI
jgi:BirA family biotin operon repressor/biotin-[acetyl-CoA-carboxylase] ligase